MQRHKKLCGLSVLLAVGVGGLSGFLSRNGMKEYASLKRPPLSPPGAVFPVVWTILFILMGIGAAMVWLTRRTERVRALAVYGIQLAVNFFWSILFFREGMRLLAFFWLLLLLGLVALMIRLFGRVSRTAAWLQLPYFFWLCFAAYLNLGVWWLNR